MEQVISQFKVLQEKGSVFQANSIKPNLEVVNRLKKYEYTNLCLWGCQEKKKRLIWERRYFQNTTTFPVWVFFFFFFGAAVVQLMNNDTEFLESFKITFLSFFSSWKFQSRECSPPVARQCRPDLHRSQCIASCTCQPPCFVILRRSFSC